LRVFGRPVNLSRDIADRSFATARVYVLDPRRPDVRSTCYRWLKLYRAIVGPTIWTYIEMGDRNASSRPLPKYVAAGAFAIYDLCLVLVNDGQEKTMVAATGHWVARQLGEARASRSWRIPPRNLLILVRAEDR
jgi:hypothetical protein